MRPIKEPRTVTWLILIYGSRWGMALFSRTYRLLQWSATLAAGLPEKVVMDTSRPLQGRLRLGPPHKLEET